MEQQAQKKERGRGGGVGLHEGASIAPVTVEITTTFIVRQSRTPESIMESGNFAESPAGQMDRQGWRRV